MKPSLRLISAFSRGAPRDRPDQRPLNGAFDARYNVCSLVARETTRAPDGLRSTRTPYGDPSCGTCETCDDEYFTFMEQSCDSRGLPGSGVLDCHACCT